jgi:hypothetical protein
MIVDGNTRVNNRRLFFVFDLILDICPSERDQGISPPESRCTAGTFLGDVRDSRRRRAIAITVVPQSRHSIENDDGGVS